MFSTKTIQSVITDANVDGFSGYDAEILNGTFARDYLSIIAAEGDTNNAFKEWATRFIPWSARVGFKLSF